ncbi:MAG: hypothetical protein N2545_03635 [Thermoflexales bacterium]|nr:hypothetical protein [Thermoflexales bacterium]
MSCTLRCVLLALVLAVLAFAPAAQAQAPNPYARIGVPASNQPLREHVTIQGTATHPQFVRYELAYALEPDLATWISLGGSVQPVENGVLGVWNTRPLTPGSYALRLQVFAADGSVSESLVRNLIVVDAPVPTPTASTATPLQSGSSEIRAARDLFQALSAIVAAAPGAFFRGMQFMLLAFLAFGAYLLLKRLVGRWLRLAEREQPFRD